MAEAVALPAASTDRLEQFGFVSLCGVAGALQFSIAAAQILLTLVTICWLTLLATGRVRFSVPRSFWPLLAYAGLTLVSAAFSPDPRTSLIDCKQLVLFAIVPLTVALVPGGGRAVTLLTVVLTCAAASATVGILQYGVLHYDNLGQRVQGTLGHYMTYSGLLMLVIAVALARVLFGGRDRVWAALVMPALAVAVAISLTRSASVGVLAAAAVLFALKDFRLFALVPILGAIFIAVAPGTITERLTSFSMSDETVRDRIAMLHIGERMVRAHPLTGVGPKMVQEHYAEYRGPDAVKEINPHLHNVPVQIAAERGVPALAAWLVFIGMLLVDLWSRFRGAEGSRRTAPATAIAAVVAMVAAGMFEYNFGDSEFLMLFLILITLPFATARTAHT